MELVWMVDRNRPAAIFPARFPQPLVGIQPQREVHAAQVRRQPDGTGGRKFGANAACGITAAMPNAGSCRIEIAGPRNFG